jgi:hypothetical protein
MSTNSFSKFLQNFETANVLAYLQSLELQQLVQSPYFLSGTVVLAIICLIMRWRVLLVAVLSISGFVWLLSYTMARGASLESGGGNETLLIFVGGGAVLVFLVIYLLFIRGE